MCNAGFGFTHGSLGPAPSTKQLKMPLASLCELCGCAFCNRPPTAPEIITEQTKLMETQLLLNELKESLKSFYPISFRLPFSTNPIELAENKRKTKTGYEKHCTQLAKVLTTYFRPKTPFIYIYLYNHSSTIISLCFSKKNILPDAFTHRLFGFNPVFQPECSDLT